MRGQADQAGDLLAADAAELRQFGNAGMGRDAADAGLLIEQLGEIAPERAGLDGVADVAIDVLELGLDAAQ